jgi:hypothetical protein
MKSHSFNGRRYRIYTGAKDGFCDPPKNKELELHIFANLRTRNGLITAIHESLHAENENWSEDCVDRMSKEIGKFLWRLGYRLKRSK